MQLFRSLVLTVALAVSLAACGGRTQAADNAGLGAITAIEMTKSECFGTCPSYTVRFTANGRATYDGGHFAPLRGRFSGLVDFPPLAAWVATQHPETLRARYAAGTIDSQIVTLTIDQGARRQRITTSEESVVPLRFEGILLALDGVTTRIRWRRDDAATVFLGMFSGPSAASSDPFGGVDIDQSVNGAFYAHGRTLQCGNAQASVTHAGSAMRLRCATRSSVLHATADGFRAEGDAIPAGAYRRLDPHGASVMSGMRPEPRSTE